MHCSHRDIHLLLKGGGLLSYGCHVSTSKQMETPHGSVECECCKSDLDAESLVLVLVCPCPSESESHVRFISVSVAQGMYHCSRASRKLQC